MLINSGYLTGSLDRIGMHLLFYGKKQVRLLEGGKLDGILREKSIQVRSVSLMETIILTKE